MGASLFVTPLLRHACPPSLPSPQEAAALAGWGAAILGRLDIDSMKKAVVKLLECEAAFLEVLAAEGEASWAEGEAALAPALRRRAELAAEATALAKAKGELAGVRPAVRALPRARPLGARRWCCVPPPPPAPPHFRRPHLPCGSSAASGPLARVLLAAAAGEDGGAQAQLVAALLPVYCEKVLSAKERGTPAALACWAALGGAASKEQVTGAPGAQGTGPCVHASACLCCLPCPPPRVHA